MKRIWAPWRMAYILEGTKEGACIFCDKLKETDTRSTLVLAQTEHSMVALNKYPYNNGHLLVAPKKHADQFTSLSPEEYADLSQALRRSVGLLSKALKPDGINLGMNLGKCAGAGVEHHLHWHVVPRWEGDTNFMPVVGEVRIMSQDLVESYDRLSPFFKDFSFGADD